MALSIRSLRTQDDRSTFRSGDIEIDRFFQRFAGQNQFKHHIGSTYVADDDGSIIGYATVSAAQIETSKLPAKIMKRLPRYPLPVLRLARLAVDESAQGRGIGLQLLRAVLSAAHTMADSVGCVGVVVDAKPQAVAFYEKYGFFALEEVLSGQLGDRPEPLVMFLELGAIPKP